MTSQQKLYIAGTGVITSVGFNTAMTAAAVNADISAYAASDFINSDGNAVTMALVPRRFFGEMDIRIDEGDRFSEQHERIIRMAALAVHEACSAQQIDYPIPFLCAKTDMQRNLTGLSSFTENLTENCKPFITAQLTRNFYSGRAAGIEALEFAFNYLLDAPQDFILIGGSDSLVDDDCLNTLDRSRRLAANGVADGFAPGDGAGFILLTKHVELAVKRNGKIIALHKPGVGSEPGHLYSDGIYRGDGLDQAFKAALKNHQHKNIQHIYSSMNGENYWAKELGVAQIRNAKALSDQVKIKHPADCYGDVGAATAPILIALAAEHLFKNKNAKTHLVYSSSDTAKRGAVVVEKFDTATKNS